MAKNSETLKLPAANPGEGLKGLLSLIQGAKAASGQPAAAATGQIGPELAYKLAQAVSQSKDREMLKTSIVALVDALEGIDIALAGEK